ncbi:hypothetical protein PV08_00889 [Exophiala spinifera]|uniref:Uncharacterized protein n=1 Tax=Exophiala spinifera TaxID=91928 RepID=A0A0D2C9Q4_9EURO|nr:uncharacterized protein PV08_00889 [Exophiala spinifera]KIW20314.1 hypothetical protein PV08_00889 [Exophiala spinifera]
MKPIIYISLFLAAGLDMTATARPLHYHYTQTHGRDEVAPYKLNQDHGRRHVTISTYHNNQNHGRDVTESINIRELQVDGGSSSSSSSHATFSSIVRHFWSLGGPDGIVTSVSHIFDRS